MCVHKRMVMWAMPVSLKDAVKNLKFLKSSLKGLNEVYGGSLYNSDEIVALYGKPQVGKTLFALQEAVASGANVLYIDTEGGFKGMAQKWLDVLVERFKAKNEVYLETCKTLDALTEFLGFRTKVIFRVADEDEGGDEEKEKRRGKEPTTVEEKIKELQKQERREARAERGKMEFRVLERFENAPIDVWIQEQKIGFVILDSISAPVRVLMPEERQNLPARASAFALIMGKLVSLQQKHNVCVLLTNHASFDPTDIYRDSTSVAMRGKEFRQCRRFWIMRIEDDLRAHNVVGAKIDDLGFHDVDDVKKLLTDSELRKLGM
jgi:RecA/RadA recombinase